MNKTIRISSLLLHRLNILEATSMYHVSVRTRIGLLASILPLVWSCRDSTAPRPAAVQASQTVQAAPSLQRIVFTDATERLIPGMADQEAGLRLQGLLADFAAAYSARDDGKAGQAIIAARKLLSRISATEHPANLSAIRLTLLGAESLLVGAEESPPPDS